MPEPELVRVVVTSADGTMSFLFSRVPCVGERIVLAVHEDLEEKEWEVTHVFHIPRRIDATNDSDPVADVHVVEASAPIA